METSCRGGAGAADELPLAGGCADLRPGGRSLCIWGVIKGPSSAEGVADVPKLMFLQRSAPQGPGCWTEAARQVYLTLRNVIWSLNPPSWQYCGAGRFFWRLGGEGRYAKRELRSGSLFPCVNINMAALVCPAITCLGITTSLEFIDTASPH